MLVALLDAALLVAAAGLVTVLVVAALLTVTGLIGGLWVTQHRASPGTTGRAAAASLMSGPSMARRRRA